MLIRGDFHMHTVNSDGSKTFQELVNIIKGIPGKKVVSVTDHHYLTLKEPIEGGNILRIPGIEISADANGQSVHITGYGIKPNFSDKLNKILETIVEGYNDRAKRIYERWIELGMQIPPLSAFRDPTLPPPLYKSDFVKQLSKITGLTDEKEVRKRSRENGNLLFSPEESFMPDVSELIPAMHESGLVTYWAHPGKSLFRNAEEQQLSAQTLEVIISSGIDGIEPYAHKHTPEQTTFFLEEAKQRNLLILGGSDYHGEEGHNIEFPIGEEYVSAFLKKIGYNGNFLI